jgi:hypothetical protein
MFFSNRLLFERKRGEALLSVAIMGHVLRSMVKSEAENDIESGFLMPSCGGQVFVTMKNLLDDL